MSDRVPPAGDRLRLPQFPAGLSPADLQAMPDKVIKETMATWFLMNHVMATGPFFGFAEARPASAAMNGSPMNTAALNQGPRSVGFDQAPFFSGGRAPDLLTAAFAGTATSEVIAEVAERFDGLWRHRPALPPGKRSDRADVLAAMSFFLSKLQEAFENMAPSHGGVGHNNPPGDMPIAEEERVSTLRAIAEMRLLVTSDAQDSVLDAAWQGIWSVVKRVGLWGAKKLDIWIDEGIKSSWRILTPVGIYCLIAWLSGQSFHSWFEILKASFPK